MPFVTYTARDSILPLHVASVVYTISFSVQRADLNVETLAERPESMSGVVETLYYGKKKVWSVTLEPIRALEAPLYEEFLDSTGNGEEFTFDPYGIPSAPVRPLLVVREDRGYNPQRKTITGLPHEEDHLEYSFMVREQ